MDFDTFVPGTDALLPGAALFLKGDVDCGRYVVKELSIVRGGTHSSFFGSF